jgi:DNA repair protein RadC
VAIASPKMSKKHQIGHRSRVRNKLINSGHQSLCDYEIVELMLFWIFKRKDVKPLAKTLIDKFKTIDRILNAPTDELLKVTGIGSAAVNTIKVIDGIVKASLKSKIVNTSTIECFDDVIDYCKVNMKNLVAEELRVIFLNAINRVVADDTVQSGDIDSIDIYPRNIIKQCLNHGAKAVILVHNHPSGDPTPSVHDVYTTKKIVEALNVFDIKLHDHIIIGGDRYISFKSLNLLEQ